MTNGLLFPEVQQPIVFSLDRRFRYLLTRRWSDVAPMLTWLMLNPSITDEDVNDPTVERCMRRASRQGYGGIYVVNLFAFITPYPWVMKEVLATGGDIVGPRNDEFILRAAKGAKDVITAWGTDGEIGGRGAAVRDLLRLAGITPQCLGLTRDGHPRHPLYVSYETEFEVLPPTTTKGKP